MILIDFSSIIHRKLHTAISAIKPAKDDDDLYITSEFVGLAKYYIFQELFSIKQEFGPKFGDIVICLDKSDGGYWRRDVYSGYKASRRVGREKSEINFGEYFDHINKLIDQIRINLPWKVVEVSRAEADDSMLVLAKEYNTYELVLIHSPDKDMIQAQRGTDKVYQYSALSKKWLVPENKHDDMDAWIQEHVCLGDASDDVPRIVDNTEFSDAFIAYLHMQGYMNMETPMDFKNSSMPKEDKLKLIDRFDVYKLNRKKESTGVKDIYKSIRFGPSNLKKKIVEFGSLDKWLDSHPLYRPNYDRNFTLVMEEGIPSNIWNEILISYKEAKVDYNDKDFEDYLKNNDLKSILMDLPNHFKLNRDLTADDFGW